MALTKIPSELSSTTGIVDNSNATAITIDSSGNVEVKGGQELRVYRGDNATYGSMKYLTGSGGLQLNDKNGDGISFVQADGATEYMRIDASGNVLVGCTAYPDDTVNNTMGFGVASTGETIAAVNGGRAAVFKRATSDGSIVEFYKDGSTVGSIGTEGGDLAIGNGDAGIQFVNGNEHFRPFNVTTNAATDNLMDIGSSTKRFKDLYLSSDIYLNNTNKSSIPSGALSLIFNTSSPSSANVLSGGYGGSHAHQQFYHGGSLVGNITTTASSTAYNTSSDYRLKENVVELTGATERLKQLNPSRFNFIADADTTVDGFLAHEVADVVPEAISGEKDAMKDEEYEVTPAVLDEEGNVVTEAVIGTRSVPEYQGIDQSKLVPLLVATIQELEARITELENN